MNESLLRFCTKVMHSLTDVCTDVHLSRNGFNYINMSVTTKKELNEMICGNFLFSPPV